MILDQSNHFKSVFFSFGQKLYFFKNNYGPSPSLTKLIQTHPIRVKVIYKHLKCSYEMYQKLGDLSDPIQLFVL